MEDLPPPQPDLEVFEFDDWCWCSQASLARGAACDPHASGSDSRASSRPVSHPIDESGWRRGSVPAFHRTPRAPGRARPAAPSAPGSGTAPRTIPSAPFAFSQANADGWMPADEGSWPRNSGDQTSCGAAVPGRDGAFGGRAIGSRHHVSAIVGPGHAEWKASRLDGVPDPSARALLPEIRFACPARPRQVRR